MGDNTCFQYQYHRHLKVVLVLYSPETLDHALGEDLLRERFVPPYNDIFLTATILVKTENQDITDVYFCKQPTKTHFINSFNPKNKCQYDPGSVQPSERFFFFCLKQQTVCALNDHCTAHGHVSLIYIQILPLLPIVWVI